MPVLHDLAAAPPISVVVPTHGRVDLVNDTLGSLCRQTLDRFELIVTDDSPDPTDRAQIEQAVRMYRIQTNREAHYIFSQAKLGQARNTNQGLRRARGRFVRILHSDDLLAPKTLETEVTLGQDRRLGLDMLFHLVEPFRTAPRFDRQPSLSLVQPSLLFRSMMHSQTPLPSATVVRRELLDAVGGLREDLDFLCDWEFAARLIAAQHHRHRFVGMLSPGYVGWRQHGDSTTGRLWARHFHEHEQFMRELRADPEQFEALVGDRDAQRQFFATAVRYRYQRLSEDVSKMRWRQAIRALPQIIRCVGSPGSCLERLTAVAWRVGNLGQRRCVVSTGHRIQERPTLNDPRRGARSVLAAYFTNGIMWWAASYARRHFVSAPRPQRPTSGGPDVVATGAQVEIRPSLEAPLRSEGSLIIHTEYNNSTNLWPLRHLIRDMARVRLTRLNTNAFIEPVLNEAVKFIAVGAELEVPLTDNHHLTAFGFKSLLDKQCAGEFTWCSQDTAGARTHVLRYRRHRPGPEWHNAPHTGWTFGMLTTGTRPKNVERFIDSIERYCREPYEILLVSPVDLGQLAARPGVRVIRFAERDDLGWITKKKNLIARDAKYSDILICHDRFSLDEHFISSCADWGYAYGLAAPRVRLPDGRRGLDWAVVSSQNQVWSSGGLLDYRAYSQYAYNPGGATVVRKEFWRRFRWNENLFWNEHEDVELCRRVQRSGQIVRLTSGSLIAAEDRWMDNNPKIPYCDQNEVLYGRPVGEQRIYFIPNKKAA